jgi:hypothetical protein
MREDRVSDRQSWVIVKMTKVREEKKTWQGTIFYVDDWGLRLLEEGKGKRLGVCSPPLPPR